MKDATAVIAEHDAVWPAKTSSDRLAALRRVRTPATAGLFAVTLLAAALRVVALGHLNFREDEGFSLTFARQSWAGVLGFHGFYDFHPPLDFALAKLAGLVLPELLASRAVSALAAVATFPIFFALVRRLLDQRAAIAACLVLALSPAHVEFSRVGRMYAPVVFAIACAYLAIVGFAEDGRLRWAALYAGAVALALYLDYSAVYALLPQAVPLAWLLSERRRKALPLIGGGVAGVVLYIPWLTQLPRTIRLANAYARRTTYLDASWGHILATIPPLVGLSGGGAGQRAPWPNLWFRWPALHIPLALAIVPVAVVGVLVLRRQPLALLVAACLAIGTPLTSIVMSLLSPGFTLRTVLPATLGWAIVVGAVAARVSIPRPQRAFALVSAAVLLISSVNALPAVYSNVGRSLRYDEAAETLAETASLGYPILTYSTVGMDSDVIEAMQGARLRQATIITVVDGKLELESGMDRWLGRGPSRLDVEAGKLPQILQPVAAHDQALWFLTHRNPASFHAAFTTLGYRRLLVLDDAHLTLELWAKPDAVIGSAVEINGAFAGDATTATGWSLPAGATFHPAATGRALDLPGGATVEATHRIDRAGAGLYAIDALAIGDTSATATLKCRSPGGKTLAASKTTAKDAAQTGDADALQAAVLCPPATSAVVVVLSATHGSATFSNLRLTGTSLHA